jgi:hypothetical protein
VAPITSEETRTLMARVEVTSVLMFLVLGLITLKPIPLAEVPAIPVNAADEVCIYKSSERVASRKRLPFSTEPCSCNHTCRD